MLAAIRHRQVKIATLWGALGNTLQGIIKIIFGIVGHSHALFADGIHSFSDVLTDALVIVASRYGSQAADKEHPYGHQRFETAATMLLSLILIIVGLGIAYDSLMHIKLRHFVRPGWSVVIVAIISILINEGLFHYTKRIGQRFKSALLIANAWHHRSDAASSIVVLIGVLGTFAGFRHLDLAAAIIVGILVVKMGISLTWSSVRELVDTGVEPQLLEKISHTIEQVPGVLAIHQLRTRSMGGAILIDVHVLAGSYISVSEGHHIALCVHKALLENVSGIRDVIVHIDPENDEIASPCVHLPSRQELLPTLQQLWENLPDFSPPQHVIIHYLDGKIYLELYFKLSDIYSQQLDFGRGAREDEQRSVLNIHEHANRARNKAQNSSAKSKHTLEDYQKRYTELLHELPNLGTVKAYAST